jgi:hypothetical protein
MGMRPRNLSKTNASPWSSAKTWRRFSQGIQTQVRIEGFTSAFALKVADTRLANAPYFFAGAEPKSLPFFFIAVSNAVRAVSHADAISGI